MAEALAIQVTRDFGPAWRIEPVRFTVGARGDKTQIFDSPAAGGEGLWVALSR